MYTAPLIRTTITTQSTLALYTSHDCIIYTLEWNEEGPVVDNTVTVSRIVLKKIHNAETMNVQMVISRVDLKDIIQCFTPTISID